MQKPTLKEISQHMDNQQEAILFYNYYESQGWKVGKNPMKSWKSAASGWLNRNKKREIKSQSKVDQAIANTSTKLIDLLWVRMTEIYGHKWVSSYGATPNKPWTDVVSAMGKEKISHGLNLMIKDGDDWPCSLIKFSQYCNSYRCPHKALTHLPGRKEILHQRETTKASRDAALKEIYSVIV